VMVELLADDAARRRTGAVPLARALVKLAGAPATPVGTLGAGSVTRLRLDRLAHPQTTYPATALASYLLATLLLIGPTVSLAVPWIQTAWMTLS